MREAYAADHSVVIASWWWQKQGMRDIPSQIR
jgi:hypothetical protein